MYIDSELVLNAASEKERQWDVFGQEAGDQGRIIVGDPDCRVELAVGLECRRPPRAGILRRRRDIDRGTEQGDGLEQFRIFQHKSQRAVAAHRLAANHPAVAADDGAKPPIHIRDQVLDKGGLHLLLAIDIPAFPGRRHHHQTRRDLAVGDQFVDQRDDIALDDPLLGILAVAVQQIEHRVVLLALRITVRQIHVVVPVAVERGGGEIDFCNFARPCGDGARHRSEQNGAIGETRQEST